MIEKGHVLFLRINNCQLAKELIESVNEVNLVCSKNSCTIARIYCRGGIWINGVNLPPEIIEQIESETIRYRSRLIRILDHEEFRLKQELEDL